MISDDLNITVRRLDNNGAGNLGALMLWTREREVKEVVRTTRRASHG